MTGSALRVTGGPIALTVVPERGNRITSVSAGGREWLVPDGSGPAAFGDPFVRDGLGGWDELLPTVAPERTESGVLLPDHGEAWSAAWSVAESSAALVRAVLELETVPLTIERTVTAEDDGVRLAYRVTNRSDRRQPLLWSAHPLFAADAATLLELPAIDEGLDFDEDYPARGATRALGARTPFRELARRGPVKLFAPGGSDLRSARLRHSDGTTLSLSWGGEQALSLGLFADDGTLGGSAVIAIEPTTGRSDSLRRAVAAGDCWSVPAGGETSWWVRLGL